MSVGQEGDTRQYRKSKRGDYAETKAASEHKQPKAPVCKICRQEIVGENFSGFCLRCHDEPL